MTMFAERFKIESNRLIGWNYSQSGVYFVTICTRYQNNFLGKIVDGKIVYKMAGDICKTELLKTFEIRQNLKLIAWVVMPNHVHVLFSVGDFPVETRCNASLPGDSNGVTVISSYRNHPGFFEKLNMKSNQEVSKVIREFKGAVKRETIWQERYFDEIIKDEERLRVIKYYIKNNPKNWEKDKLYHKNAPACGGI